MQWWQIGLGLLPWVFERLWTIRGLKKKVPPIAQKAVEQAVTLAVQQEVARHLGNSKPSSAPPVPAGPKK